MSYKAQGAGAFILALFFAIALTGKPVSVAGFHQNCIDGIDNGDGDGLADGSDMECLIYPFSDGGGEFGTTAGKKWSSDEYTYSIFDYQLQYGDPTVQNDLCFDQTGKQNEFDGYQTASGGKDSSGDDYTAWLATFPCD